MMAVAGMMDAAAGGVSFSHAAMQWVALAVIYNGMTRTCLQALKLCF